MLESWEPWAVVWEQSANADLQRLDRRLKERIWAAVERLAQTGHGDVRRLQAYDPPLYALRVGDWRVRFARDTATRTLTVLRVLSRGRAYRG